MWLRYVSAVPRTGNHRSLVLASTGIARQTQATMSVLGQALSHTQTHLLSRVVCSIYRGLISNILCTH
jgi:hypothetical protein